MEYFAKNIKILLYKYKLKTFSIYTFQYWYQLNHFSLLITSKFEQLISKIASIYFLCLTGRAENVRPFQILADSITSVAKNLEQPWINRFHIPTMEVVLFNTDSDRFNN